MNRARRTITERVEVSGSTEGQSTPEAVGFRVTE